MISSVRDFMIARIKEESSDFKEWKDGFNRDNIPRTIFNRAFFIQYNSVTLQDDEGCFFFDDVSMNVDLFFKGFRDPQSALDSAMDTAQNIRRRAMNPKRAGDVIKRVDGLSITPEPVDTNDNAIIVSLSFNLRTVFEVL